MVHFASLDVNEDISFGFPVAEAIIEPIRKSFGQYPQYVEQEVPRNKWYLELLNLEQVKNPKQYFGKLKLPLPQQFVPTTRITHVGRGLDKHQLWAYAEPSQVLLNLRLELIARLKTMRFQFADDFKAEDFTPHITIAKLFPIAGAVGLADFPVNLSFSCLSIDIASNSETLFSIDLAS